MAHYVITYDLNRLKDYARLTKALTDLGAAKLALSVWLLERYNTNAFGIRDHLLHFIDDDDLLAVIEFNSKPAHARALTEGADWIVKRYG